MPIGRVSDAVVAHVAGSDAQSQRINTSYVTFRRMALGDDAGGAEPRDGLISSDLAFNSWFAVRGLA